MELIVDDNLVGCGVYKITIGEYFYIGSSKNLQNRVREHKSKINTTFDTNSNFLKIKDYAKDKDIKIELLELCSDFDLVDREFDFIRQNNNNKFMLNIRNGIKLRQIFATVNQETINKIKEIAKSLNRTFSQTVEILLEKAIKERDRKKKK